MATCDRCGADLSVGDWPFCPHGRPLAYHPFVAYYDHGLGEQVTSLADRWRFMRQKQLVDRPLPSKGDLSARADRCHEQKRSAS